MYKRLHKFLGKMDAFILNSFVSERNTPLTMPQSSCIMYVYYIGDVQYIGGVQYIRGYHEYIGGIS